MPQLFLGTPLRSSSGAVDPLQPVAIFKVNDRSAPWKRSLDSPAERISVPRQPSFAGGDDLHQIISRLLIFAFELEDYAPV